MQFVCESAALCSSCVRARLDRDHSAVHHELGAGDKAAII